MEQPPRVKWVTGGLNLRVQPKCFALQSRSDCPTSLHFIERAKDDNERPQPFERRMIQVSHLGLLFSCVICTIGPIILAELKRANSGVGTRSADEAERIRRSFLPHFAVKTRKAKRGRRI